MPLFKCSKCGCVDNTATGNFWTARYTKKQPLCCKCDPKIGKWHGRFKRENADGKYVENKDGFLEPIGGWE